MTAYDIIGDVHGCGLKLEERLLELGYTFDFRSGAHRHESRTAVFVGDLIDRGQSQLHALEIVKAMSDAGTALVVMGNHEFNALAYATEHPGRPGEYLRSHNAKNRSQHEAFLYQLTADQQSYYLDWFRTLPLWLELDGLRVVHACWHEPSRETVRQSLGGDRFTSVAQLAEACDGESSLWAAVEVLLKGPEVELARYDQPAFIDKDGHPRKSARLKWWKAEPANLGDLVEIAPDTLQINGDPYPELSGVAVSPEDHSFAYKDEVPVFYGHYWRQGEPHEIDDWTDNTACVDFSAVKGGTLVAYCFNGEPKIQADKYHPPAGRMVQQVPSS